MEKKPSIFDNIKVPLEDLTEEEIAEIHNSPGYQERLSKRIKEAEELASQYRKELGLDN